MKRFLLLILVLFVGCAAVNNANKFYEQGDYVAAKNSCLKILETDSLNVEAHFILGKCYLHEGQLEKAIQSFRTAWKIQPESKTTPVAKSQLIRAKIQFADTLFGREKQRQGRDELFSVLELDSTSVPALSRLGDYYYNLGLLDLATQRYEKALVYQPEAPAIQAKMTEIRQRTTAAEKDCALGIANYKKYRYQKALKYFKKALEQKPDYKDAKYYQAMANGSILVQKENKSRLWDAITEFGKAMAIRPDAGEPHYFMGMAYERKEKEEFDNAIEEYKLALEKDPKGWFAKHCQKKIKTLTKNRDILKKFWGK